MASLAWRDTSPIVFRLVQGVSQGKANRRVGRYGGNGCSWEVRLFAGVLVRDLQGVAGLKVLGSKGKYGRPLVRNSDLRVSYYLIRSHKSLNVALFRSITPPFPSSRGIRSRRSLP